MPLSWNLLSHGWHRLAYSLTLPGFPGSWSHLQPHFEANPSSLHAAHTKALLKTFNYSVQPDLINPHSLAQQVSVQNVWNAFRCSCGPLRSTSAVLIARTGHATLSARIPPHSNGRFAEFVQQLSAVRTLARLPHGRLDLLATHT